MRSGTAIIENLFILDAPTVGMNKPAKIAIVALVIVAVIGIGSGVASQAQDASPNVPYNQCINDCLATGNSTITQCVVQCNASDD